MAKRKSSGKSSHSKRPRVARKKRVARKMRKQSTIVNLGLGFPKRVLVKHRYAEQVTLTSTAGVPAYYRFTTNGMFDPNTTGAGHQPKYFDQLSALYNQYTVIGSKMRARIVPSATNGAASLITFLVDDDASLTNNAPIVNQEEPNSRRIIVPPGSNNVINTSLGWSAKKNFGGSVMANNDLQGTPTSNPSEQEYFTFAFGACDASSTVSFYVEVLIEYVAVWTELKDVLYS